MPLGTCLRLAAVSDRCASRCRCPCAGSGRYPAGEKPLRLNVSATGQRLACTMRLIDNVLMPATIAGNMNTGSERKPMGGRSVRRCDGLTACSRNEPKRNPMWLNKSQSRKAETGNWIGDFARCEGCSSIALQSCSFHELERGASHDQPNEELTRFCENELNPT